MKTLSFLAIAMVLMSVVAAAGCTDTSSYPSSFEDVFEKVSEIPLDDEALIYGVSDLDVDDDGRLLIADMQSRKLHLYDGDGAQIDTYSPTSCDPEDERGARKVRFIGDDRFVAGYPPSGPAYEFSTVDGCLRRIEDMTPSPRSFCSMADGTVYGYHYSYQPPRGVVVRYDDNLRAVDSTFLPETPFARLNLVFNINEYIACYPDESVRYVYIDSPAPAPLPQTDARAVPAPANYRRMPDDVEHAEGGPDDFDEGRRLSFEGGMPVMSAWALGTGTTMTEYALHRYSQGQYHTLYYVYGADVNVTVRIDNRIQPGFIVAKDGFAYSVVQPGRETMQLSSANAGHPNPVVLKYRLRPSIRERN